MVMISIESPANSWLWAVLVKLARDHSPEAATAFNYLQFVYFHACCHDSTRRKHTAWLSTPGAMTMPTNNGEYAGKQDHGSSIPPQKPITRIASTTSGGVPGSKLFSQGFLSV